MKPILSDADRDKLRIIYTRLLSLNGGKLEVGVMEDLLNQAIIIAEEYGSVDNDLLLSLKQTANEQLPLAKKGSIKYRKRQEILSDLKLHLLGDLLGWFQRTPDK